MKKCSPIMEDAIKEALRFCNCAIWAKTYVRRLSFNDSAIKVKDKNTRELLGACELVQLDNDELFWNLEVFRYSFRIEGRGSLLSLSDVLEKWWDSLSDMCL